MFRDAKSVSNLQSSQNTISNDQNLFLPNTSGFKLASLNVTSLLKHIDELRILLANNMIDVLAINETRLDFTVSDREVHIDGYMRLFDVIELPMVDLAEGYAFISVIA